MSNYYDSLETREPEVRRTEIARCLSAQLENARDNAPAYAGSLKPFEFSADTVLAEMGQYPITRKSELIERQRQQPPFGGLVSTKAEQPAYIFASPGPIYELSTQRTDYWRMARALYATGLREGEIVHNCFSYHLTPAGSLADTGCHALGCTVIPAGVGNTELQVQTIHDLKPTCYVGTPSFLKIILEKADEMGVDVSSINKALVSGEALPPSLRTRFIERGIYTLQCYATADIGLIAYESSPDSGLIVDEGLYLEIVRPGTGDPVESGEVGEVVVTTFNPDYPLIRFATGDLSAVMDGTSDCGRSNQRIKGWMGRADQTAKVRGMFIHPEQVDQVVKRHPEIVKARLIIDWVNESDQMTLHCEIDSGPGSDSASSELAEAISASIRECCKVRGEVNFVDVNGLVNDGLVIEDIRSYD